MNNEKRLVKNTVVLSFGTMLPKVVSIITIPILTAGLSKVEYGTYDLITTLVSLLLPVLTLQIQSAAFRFLIECRGDRKKSSVIATNIFAVTLPVSIIALIMFYLVLNSLSPLVRILICAYYFCDIVFLAVQQLARGIGRNSYYSVSAIIVSLVNLVTILIFISGLSMGLVGVLISLTVSYAVALAFLLFKIFSYLDVKKTYISLSVIKEMLSYSWPMVPNNLSSWILSLSDRLVITAFIGIEANAIYAVANKLPNLFYAVQNTFTLAWQENASEASAEESVGMYYSKMFDVIFRFVCGLMAGIIGFTPLLFKLLIRGEYDAAYVQLPILFMGCFFSSLASFFGGIYVAFKRTKSIGISTMCAAVINLVIDLLFVRDIGITAGSVSTLVSYTFLACYRMQGVKKSVDIHYNYKNVFFSILCLIVMCCLCVQRNVIFDCVNCIFCLTYAFGLNIKLVKNILSFLKNAKEKLMMK